MESKTIDNGAERKTELLVFFGAQYLNAAREGLLFKRTYDEQGYLLINFVGSSGMLPSKGSMVKVTYFLGSDGLYHGVKLLAADPEAYE